MTSIRQQITIITYLFQEDNKDPNFDIFAAAFLIRQKTGHSTNKQE